MDQQEHQHEDLQHQQLHDQQPLNRYVQHFEHLRIPEYRQHRENRRLENLQDREIRRLENLQHCENRRLENLQHHENRRLVNLQHRENRRLENLQHRENRRLENLQHRENWYLENLQHRENWHLMPYPGYYSPASSLYYGPGPMHGITSQVMANALSTSNAGESCGILRERQNNLQNPALDSSQDPVPNSIGQEGPSSNDEQTLSDDQQVSVRDPRSRNKMSFQSVLCRREGEMLSVTRIEMNTNSQSTANDFEPLTWSSMRAMNQSQLFDEQQLTQQQQRALHFQRLRDLEHQLHEVGLRHLKRMLELELEQYRHLYPMTVPYPEYCTLGSNIDGTGPMHAPAIPHCDYDSDESDPDESDPDESESDTSQESWQN